MLTLSCLREDFFFLLELYFETDYFLPQSASLAVNRHHLVLLLGVVSLQFADTTAPPSVSEYESVNNLLLD